jgi:protein SCO1
MLNELHPHWLKSTVCNRKVILFACLVFACFGTLSECVFAQDPASKKHIGHKQPDRPVVVSRAEEKTEFVLPDVEVLDQNGKKLKFYTDLVKGRTVVINFIYTTCKSVCPLSGEHFAKLQAALGEKLGREVFLISVTTDPETDSPAKLRDWSKKYNPAPGWTLVTGSKKNILSLLLVLTGDGTQTGYHVPAICLIDDRTKSHRWAYGLSDPAEIMRMMKSPIN